MRLGARGRRAKGGAPNGQNRRADRQGLLQSLANHVTLHNSVRKLALLLTVTLR